VIRAPITNTPPEGTWVNTHTERVRFGDTDAAGIVYYANYLRWFEAGRSEWMLALDIDFHNMFEGHQTVVVETWCRLHSPARFMDQVSISTWLHEYNRTSVLFAHHIDRDGVRLADGAVRLVMVDDSGRPRRLPQSFLDMVPSTR